MRFRQQEEILVRNLPRLNIKTSVIGSGSAQQLQIHDASQLIEALREIYELGFITEEIIALKKLNIPLNLYVADGESIRITATSSQLSDIIDLIILKCEAVIESLNLSLPKQEDNSIIIGLPNIEYFKDLDSLVKKINECLVLISGNDKISKNEIKFQNFDTGTSWIEVVMVAGPAAMFLIGSAVDICSKMAYRIQEHKLTKQAIKKMEHDSEIQRKIIEELGKGIQNDIQKGFTESIKKSDDDIDYDLSPEYLERAKKGLSMLSELMEDGTTFEAAKESLEFVRDSFPTLEDQKRLSEPIYLSDQKKIESLSEEDGE